MDQELEDKIREKFKEQGHDYDVAKLVFRLEYQKMIDENKRK